MSKRLTRLTNPIEVVVAGYFGDLPVVESDTPLLMVPNGDDAVGAVPDDVTNCLLARCARRTLGRDLQVFFRTIAYIQMPTETGDVVMRFRIPQTSRARHFIDTLDEQGVVGATHALRLEPTRGTHDELRAHRERSRARRATGQPVQRRVPRTVPYVPRRGNFTLRTHAAQQEA